MEFRILGPLEVGVDGRVLELGGSRQRALLAALLIRRNEVVPADRLLEALYGNELPATAAKTLQAHMSRLRKALDPDRIRTKGSGYLLSTTSEEVDAERFEELIEAGRAGLGTGDPAAAEHAFGEALALWRGPALDDVAYDDFAQGEIARLDELRAVCVETRAEARLALGQHAELVPELEALVAENPRRERLRGLLMLALYRAGRQADALEAGRRGRAVLDELGLEPDPQLRELERAILNQDPSLDAPRPPAASDGTAPAAEPAAGRLAAGAFVGREAELRLLTDAVADARAGRGRLVVVSGEAGIGKSRLTDEVAAHAKALGVRVLWGRCWEAGGAPAFWPWVQALRSLVRDADPDVLREQLGRTAPEVAHLLPELRELYPDLAEPAALDSDGARFRLFEATASFLRSAAANEPLVVVLDDVHAADAPSLLMLEFVVGELADARVLLLAAYRDPELDPGDPQAAALASLARRASARLTLHGLPRPEVATFVAASAGVEPHESVVAAIADETEGNPLFVGEIVRLLAAEGRLAEEVGSSWRMAIPETVKEVVGRRLRGLSDDCRETLDVASAIGREFPLELLEQVGGRAAGAELELLDEAVVARLVTDVPGSPGRLRFTHALVRDTLYDALAQGRRLELHRRIGEAIEAEAAADPARLSEVAHHFFQALPAVDPALTVTHATRAARHARELLAYEEAARLYEAALQASSLLPAQQREAHELDLLLGLGDAWARSGRMPPARDAFLQAAALARRSGSAEGLAKAALGYGGRIVWARASGDRLVVSLFEEALAALGDEDSALRSRVLARLAGALRDERDPARRVTLAEEAVAIARRVVEPESEAVRGAALSFALAGLAGAQLGGADLARRRAVIDELLAVARANGDKEAECEGLMNVIIVHAERNEIGAVRQALARMVVLAEELRQPSQLWFASAGAAILALHDGRFADAQAQADRAHAVGLSAQAAESACAHAVHLLILRREQLRGAEAYDELASVAAAYPARPFFRASLAALCIELGREAEARRLFEELAPDGFEIVPRDNEWLLAAHYLAETCCELGDVTRAAVLYDELEPIAAKSTINAPEGGVGTLARSVAGLALLLGRDEDARRLTELAIELDDAAGARPWAAHARVDLAEQLLRAGDRDPALALLSEARAVATELDAPALAARIEAVGSEM